VSPSWKTLPAARNGARSSAAPPPRSLLAMHPAPHVRGLPRALTGLAAGEPPGPDSWRSRPGRGAWPCVVASVWLL